MERKSFGGGSQSQIPCDRKGSVFRVASKIIDDVTEGLLTPCRLKKLSKKQIKAAVTLGKLPPSVLNQDILEITSSEIINDISEGTLPQEALSVLRPEQLMDAIEKGRVSLQVTKRKSCKSIDRTVKLPQISSSQFTVETCCSRNRIDEIEEIKRAVARGAMHSSALWEKAGMLPSDIIIDVRDGILPETVLKVLDPEDLFVAIEEGILEPSVLKLVNMEILLQVVAEEKIPYCVAQASQLSPSVIPEECCKYDTPSRELPFSVTLNIFKQVETENRTSGMGTSGAMRGVPWSQDEASSIFSEPAFNEFEPERNETMFEQGNIPEKGADTDFIQDLINSFSETKSPLSKNNNAGNNIDPVQENFSRQLQDAVDRGFAKLAVIQKAQTDDDVEFIKKAVFNGYLPSSALRENAGLTAREIATEVTIQNLPSSALKALTVEEIRELVDNGELQWNLLTEVNLLNDFRNQ